MPQLGNVRSKVKNNNSFTFCYLLKMFCCVGYHYLMGNSEMYIRSHFKNFTPVLKASN